MTKAEEARSLVLRSVQRQITAMGSRAYDLALLDRSAGTMQHCMNWAPEQVLRDIDWLPYANWQGGTRASGSASRRSCWWMISTPSSFTVSARPAWSQR